MRKASPKRPSPKRPNPKRRPTKTPGGRRWSATVMRESDALSLEPEIFRSRSAKTIAASLKRSAERSRRRKSSPYRSAMSMLTFFINRAGRNLTASRRRTLERAKTELRRQFGKSGE